MKQSIYWIISLSLFCLIAYVTIKYRHDIADTYILLRIDWFFYGFLFYLINYFLRASRYCLYLGNITIIQFRNIVKSACFHGFCNYFLPMRSGDASLPVFLNLYCAVPVNKGIKLLLKARLHDLISLGILIVTIPFNINSQLDQTNRLFLSFFGLLLIICPFALIYFSRNYIKIIPGRFINKIINSPPQYPRTYELVVSFGIWLSTGGALYCVTQALNIPLTFRDIWLVIAVQLPLQLIPVQGFANSGNHELGWVGALTIMGINMEDSLNFAISSHLLLLCYVLLLGGIALVLPPYRPSSTT